MTTGPLRGSRVSVAREGSEGNLGLIELTVYGSNRKILVNLNHVVWIEPEETRGVEMSRIRLVDHEAFSVLETYDEIVALLSVAPCAPCRGCTPMVK